MLPTCGRYRTISGQFRSTKAELLQEGIFFLIHLFAILVIKTLEIEKTRPTFITSDLKVEY